MPNFQYADPLASIVVLGIGLLVTEFITPFHQDIPPGLASIAVLCSDCRLLMLTRDYAVPV